MGCRIKAAESILSQIGISPSSAIQMLYNQIVLKKGIPFELRLPSARPTAIGGMTREQLDAELMKGIEKGHTVSFCCRSAGSTGTICWAIIPTVEVRTIYLE